MIEARGGFRFAAEALEMRFGGPRTQPDDFECYETIETFLTCPIHDTLAATTNFFL